MAIRASIAISRRHCHITANTRSRWDVLGWAPGACDLSAGADFYVARCTRLAGHDDKLAKLGRSRDPSLGHDQTMAADDNVVPD